MHYSISLIVNSLRRDIALADPRVTLLDLLREELHLTGTKKGCDRIRDADVCESTSRSPRVDSAKWILGSVREAGGDRHRALRAGPGWVKTVQGVVARSAREDRAGHTTSLT